MRTTLALAALAQAACTLGAPSDAKLDLKMPSAIKGFTKGFKDPRITSSLEGKALCVSGSVPVEASATNIKLDLENPKNTSQVIGYLVDSVSLNSTIGRLVAGEQTVGGVYDIWSQICVPVEGKVNTKTLQFLIHGAGVDSRYWSPAEGYSYLDFAAEQGFVTFSYDRLGTGNSDHPDPIQEVQTNLQVEIAHELIQMLRKGKIIDHVFDNIVSVGHSFGSQQTSIITAKYPKAIDAAILTGFTADPNPVAMPISFVGYGAGIASEVDPLRFAGLPSGYLVPPTTSGSQILFLKSPGFDGKMYYAAGEQKSTNTLGELLSPAELQVAKDFTGPVFVINGENDMPNCLGNCRNPDDKTKQVQKMLYPKAAKGSDSHVLNGTGHGLTYHYTAREGYGYMHKFLKDNGF